MDTSPYFGILLALFFIFYPILRKLFESLQKKLDPADKEEVRQEKLEKFKKFLGSIEEEEAPRPKKRAPPSPPPKKASSKALLAQREKLHSKIEESKELSSIKQRKLTSTIETRSLNPTTEEAFNQRWGASDVPPAITTPSTSLPQILRKLSPSQQMILYSEILKGPKSKRDRCTRN